MFLGLSLVLTAWLAGQNALPGGITIAEIPGDGSVYEVQAGYRAGIRHEINGRTGLAFTTAAFLALTPSGRSLTLAVYSAGGDISFFSELDRTGVRLRTPAWAKPMVDAALAEFLKEAPAADSPEVAHALLAGREVAVTRESEFRAQVDDQIRLALLGAAPYHHPPTGWSADIESLSAADIEKFFQDNFGTDRAFLLTSSTPPPLSSITPRSSSGSDRSTSRPIAPALRELRFPEQESGGAVVFAAPVASVFYRGWYALVLLDKVIKAIVPGYPFSTIVPALNPYYYRFEVAVPAGQSADAVEQVVMQELERLQYVQVSAEILTRARSEALQFLESNAVRNWFTSLGIDDRRREGMEWVGAFSADDLRVAARELLVSNRVVALWSPKPKQVRVETANIGTPAQPRPLSAETSAPGFLPAIAAVPFPPHPAHEDKSTASQLPAGAQNLPAALVFKSLLDRRLIETGLWSRGSISVRPPGEQGFLIGGSPAVQTQIQAWIKEIGDTAPPLELVQWARETAVHRLEAEPEEAFGVVASQLQAVAPEHLQDVARIHFAAQ